MARADAFLPEDFILQLSRLEERTDEIVPKVLAAGGEVVLDAVRTRLRAVIGSGTKKPSRSTGELVDALGLAPARLNRYGDWDAKVGFDEPRKGKGDSKRANIKHFLKVLKRQENLIDEFDEELWYITVDRVEVHADKRLSFIFRDGAAVEVASEK